MTGPHPNIGGAIFRKIGDLPAHKYLLLMSSFMVFFFAVLAVGEFVLRGFRYSISGIWATTWFLILLWSIPFYRRQERENSATREIDSQCVCKSLSKGRPCCQCGRY